MNDDDKITLTREQAEALIESWEGSPSQASARGSIEAIREQLKPRRAQHTPGPFTIKPHGEYFRIHAETNHMVAIVYGGRADADLFAAASDSWRRACEAEAENDRLQEALDNLSSACLAEPDGIIDLTAVMAYALDARALLDEKEGDDE